MQEWSLTPGGVSQAMSASESVENGVDDHERHSRWEREAGLSAVAHQLEQIATAHLLEC